MGALPKQRRSRARQGIHRAQIRLELPHIVSCPQCKRPRLSHHACPNCGTYRGRQVFLPKEKNK